MDSPLVQAHGIADWEPLPKKVYRKRGRYYLVHKNKWYNLGATKSAGQKRLGELANELGVAVVNFDFLRNLFWCAKKRARYLKVEFTLTLDDVLAMWRDGKGRCAVTGIKLSEANPTGLKRRPFIPSLDRIDPRKGYTLENTRLVCFAINAAMNAWGETVFREMANGFLRANPVP